MENERYAVNGYYGTDSNGHPQGLAEDFKTDDWSKVEEQAHEMLGKGNIVEIVDERTGGSTVLDPDLYFEDFQGEFPVKPNDLSNGVLVIEGFKDIDLKTEGTVNLETTTEEYLGGMDMDGHERKDNFGQSKQTITFRYDAENDVIRREDSENLYDMEGDPVTADEAAREIKEFSEKTEHDGDLRVFVAKGYGEERTEKPLEKEGTTIMAENETPSLPRKIDKIPEEAEKVAGYTVDHGSHGDEYWYDSTNFYKTPDGKFYEEHLEGYMGDLTFLEVTEANVISSMAQAEEHSKHQYGSHEAYRSYTDYSVTMPYVPETEAVKEWHNYGDVGFLDEGGVQVKSTEREGTFDVVMVIPHPEDDTKAFAGHTTIDVSDYREDESVMERAREAWGNAEISDEELAAIAAENGGLIEMSMTAFNENGAQAGYAMSLEAYEVDKLTLARGLEEMGIDTNGRLAELETEEAQRKVQEENDKLNYMLLSRLQQDCKYVLNIIDGGYSESLRASKKHLWAGDPDKQISKMRELYDSFDDDKKPEWITEEEIDSYAEYFTALQEKESAERPNRDLADKIEQVMFERGEYDFGESDRVRWLDNVPNAYDLADYPALLDSARERVTDCIESALDGKANEEIGGIQPLMEYLNDQINEMVEEDELIPTCEKLLSELNALENGQEVTDPVLNAKTASELSEALSSAEITEETLEALKENFTVAPMQEYLEETYGRLGYELELENASITVQEYDDEVWGTNEEELKEEENNITADVEEYLNSVDPLIAVDKDGNVAPLPFYQTEEGELITAKELVEKVHELIPETVPVTEYGRTIDNDWYSPPYTEERESTADVIADIDVIDEMNIHVDWNCDKVRTEYINEQNTKTACEMIDSMYCSVVRNDAGTYDVVDNMSGDFKAINCKDLSEVVEALEESIQKDLLDYMASELSRTDYAETTSVPTTAQEWVQFASQPENQEFVEGNKTVFEQIALVADTEAQKAASIDNTAKFFNPEQYAYYTFNINNMVNDDKVLALHGEKYEPTEEAKAILSDSKSFGMYKFELNGDNGTYDLVKLDDIKASREAELSQTLADFTSQFGVQLEEVNKFSYSTGYALYDTETGDYLQRDSYDSKTFYSADTVLTALNEKVERIKEDLSEECEAFLATKNRYGADTRVPETAAEWVAFAGRPQNKEFAESHKFELDVMRLEHSPREASLDKAYEIQKERTAEQTKEIKNPEKDKPKKEFVGKD